MTPGPLTAAYERLIGTDVLRNAELRAAGFKRESEQQAWLAGHVGAHLMWVLR